MLTIESTEVDQARCYFSHTWNQIVEVTSGLSDAQWRFKPAPDRWSIAENLEHLVLVHERVLGRVREQLPAAPAPRAGLDPRVIDTIIFEKVPDRSIKAKAPDFMCPTGSWTLPATLERLSQSYETLNHFVESTPDLREHALESAPLRVVTNGAYDHMDGYQWAITAAAHDLRHVNQILEVKADARYPA